MKKEIKILLLLVVTVIHVHLNMFTVENPANPSFWVYFVLISPPLNDRSGIFSDSLVIGIQCIVTSIFAKYLLKWNKTRVWLLLYVFCIFLYLAIRKLVAIPFDNAINQIYDCVYGYGGALNSCITFSIIQIVYIIVYWLIESHKGGG